MPTAAEITGLHAIIPTPAMSDAGRIDAVDTVDLDATTDLVEKLLADGADGLIALGTTGECATLSARDYRTFAGHLLEVVGGRVPTFVGATALGGHEVAERLRFLRERGATGTLLGLPMWQPVSTAMALDFYGQLSDSFPELAVMVYANSRAFRYDFPLEFWSALVDRAPTVCAAKYSRPKDLVALLEATRGRVAVIPNESTAATFHTTAPDTTRAMWATAAAMGPAPVVALMQAIEKRDSTAVADISAEIAWANEPVRPVFSDPAIFASYNLQLEKARINAAGYAACGPCRPPYAELPDEYAAMARECGKRWESLHARFATERQLS